METNQNQTTDKKIPIKCIVVGSTGVGKTAITERLVSGKFNKRTQPTPGFDYKNKDEIINGKNVQLNIYDTAGQEKYAQVVQNYYRGSQCALVVFDLTNKSSFNDVQKWIKSVKTLSPDATIILVGNKSDLINERIVSTEAGEQYARNFAITYIETSALTGTNVVEAFTRCAQEYIEKELPQSSQTNEQVPIQEETKEKGCCGF